MGPGLEKHTTRRERNRGSECEPDKTVLRVQVIFESGFIGAGDECEKMRQ